MVRKKNVEEARGYFQRGGGAELGSRFAALGSVCDVLELHGGRPEWKEVLAVYAVKTNNDPNDSDELITMTSKKEKLLRDVFWDMVNVTSKVETENRMVTTAVTDESGNVTEKTEEKEVVVLPIWTDSWSAGEMAVEYGFDDVQAGIVKWPLSVIRLQAGQKDRLVQLADKILCAWRAYTDEAAFIYAETNGEPHNTITPIARMRDGKFELDLVLRNNITTEEHPLGVYHPHAELHHIKKENIGQIEVMGLAVLPARLKKEVEALEKMYVEKRDFRTNEQTEKHADWMEQVIFKHPEMSSENVHEILLEEIGQVFKQVLIDAGVYKCTEEGRIAFNRFIQAVNAIN